MQESKTASADLEKTGSLAGDIAALPRTMSKPKRTIKQARELKARARTLQQLPDGSASIPAALQQTYDDLSSANQDLARSASKIEAAAVEVKDGSRDPSLGGAKKSLRRANEQIGSAYKRLSAFVTTEAGGSVSVPKPERVKLAKAKLPPLPDLAFNFTSAGVATVGAWSPSPSNADLQDAVAIFGSPDITCGEKTDNSAMNKWLGIGLEVMQADLGIGDPCEGSVQVVEIRGDAAKQWVTEAGLRIGDSEERLYELYPGATQIGSVAQDGETGVSLASTNGGVQRYFLALVKEGSVVGMNIWIGGAGE